MTAWLPTFIGVAIGTTLALFWWLGVVGLERLARRLRPPPAEPQPLDPYLAARADECRRNIARIGRK